MSKMKTIRVTLDVTITSLPREDWETDFLQDEDGIPDNDDWPIEEMDMLDFVECVEQAMYDEEMFSGNGLYLRVAEAKIVDAITVSSSLPAEDSQP